LNFIDKYVQVPRILGPLVLCLEKISELHRSSNSIAEYIDKTFGGSTALMYDCILIVGGCSVYTGIIDLIILNDPIFRVNYLLQKRYPRRLFPACF